MLRYLFPIVLVLPLLSGCTLHQPQPVELKNTPPAHYLEQGPKTEVTAIPDRWWLSFNDSRLNLLMDELFTESLELEQAFARLEQSRAVLRTVDSARYPSLNIEAQAGRSQQPQLNGDLIGNNWRIAGAAAYEIDLWNRLAAQTAAAEKDLEASAADLQTLYLSLSAQLADLYYIAIAQRAQIALADRSIASFADTVKLVESRYRQGLVTVIDVYQARQNLTAARASRHVSAANLAVAEHAIAVLIGRYPDRQSAGDLALIPDMPVFFSTGLPSELLAGRPDLQSALSRVEAADARVATAIAERFPRINLVANYGRSGQDVTAGLIEGNFWSLLGQLTLPVIDAGRRRAEVDRTRAVLQEAVSSYQRQVLTAFREVEDALAQNRESELRIEQLVATEIATRATLRLALDRYLYGLTDYLPVLTAQRNHFEVQSRLLAARQQLLSERIELARALGGNWMQEEIAQRLTTEKAATDE